MLLVSRLQYRVIVFYMRVLVTWLAYKSHKPKNSLILEMICSRILISKTLIILELPGHSNQSRTHLTPDFVPLGVSKNRDSTVVLRWE